MGMNTLFEAANAAADRVAINAIVVEAADATADRVAVNATIVNVAAHAVTLNRSPHPRASVFDRSRTTPSCSSHERTHTKLGMCWGLAGGIQSPRDYLKLNLNCSC